MTVQVVNNGDITVSGDISDKNFIIESDNPVMSVTVVSGVPGVKGEKGDSPTPDEVGALLALYLASHPISSGTVFVQNTPAATWTISHGFGRLPAVSIYDNSGQEIITDTFASSTQVVLTFAAPMAGIAILN